MEVISVSGLQMHVLFVFMPKQNFLKINLRLFNFPDHKILFANEGQPPPFCHLGCFRHKKDHFGTIFKEGRGCLIAAAQLNTLLFWLKLVLYFCYFSRYPLSVVVARMLTSLNIMGQWRDHIASKTLLTLRSLHGTHDFLQRMSSSTWQVARTLNSPCGWATSFWMEKIQTVLLHLL